MPDLFQNKLDRRFVLTALMPTTALAGWLGLLILTPGVVKTWQHQSATVRAGQVFLAVIGAVLAATLLSTQRHAVLRLFEGYWPPVLDRTVGERGRRFHRRQLRKLTATAGDQDTFAALRTRYAGDGTGGGDVLPTALGNVFAASETYPWARYRIDTVVVWPRLYQVLPERMVGTVAAARADIDLLTSCALLAGIGAVAGGAIRCAEGAPAWQVTAAFWVPSVIAWLCYQGAVRSAVTLGAAVRVAFDLHRHDLLKQLGTLPDKPESAEKEQQRWIDTARFWHRGIPLGTNAEDVGASVSTPGATPAESRLPLSAWLAFAAIVINVLFLVVPR